MERMTPQAAIPSGRDALHDGVARIHGAPPEARHAGLLFFFVAAFAS
jgi:alkylated DNA nucleotide flippase Atl1